MFLIGVEHHMKHPESGVAQAGEDLLQAGAGEDRLGGNEVLAETIMLRAQALNCRESIGTLPNAQGRASS